MNHKVLITRLPAFFANELISGQSQMTHVNRWAVWDATLSHFYLTQTPLHWTWKDFWHNVETWYSGLHPAQKGRDLVKWRVVQLGGSVRMQVSPYWQRYRLREKQSLKRRHLGISLSWEIKQNIPNTSLDGFSKELKRNRPALAFPCKLYKFTDGQEKMASFVNLQNSKVPVYPLLLIQKFDFLH